MGPASEMNRRRGNGKSRDGQLGGEADLVSDEADHVTDGDEVFGDLVGDLDFVAEGRASFFDLHDQLDSVERIEVESLFSLQKGFERDGLRIEVRKLHFGSADDEREDALPGRQVGVFRWNEFICHG